MRVEFRTIHPTDPAAAALIAALSRELADLYAEIFPMDGRSDFDPENHDSATDQFVIASRSGESAPVGCGALRRFDDGVAEVKRMYVVPSARGQGIGRAVLEYLEAAALRLGYARIVLETGVLQPDALRLYEASGYTPVPPWPPYDTRDYARCFEKFLI